MRIWATTSALTGVRGLSTSFQDFGLMQRCLQWKISRSHEPGNCIVFPSDTNMDVLYTRATCASGACELRCENNFLPRHLAYQTILGTCKVTKQAKCAVSRCKEEEYGF